MAAMVGAALEDDWRTARRINRHYFRLMLANFSEPSPAPVKTILSLMGRMEDTVRLPSSLSHPPRTANWNALAGELGLLVGAPPTGEDLRMF